MATQASVTVSSYVVDALIYGYMHAHISIINVCFKRTPGQLTYSQALYQYSWNSYNKNQLIDIILLVLNYQYYTTK